ncbi:hypothetical protein F5H01DRAFT_362178 [Linnemannia elongata]|nr:hypothetical protein F5H01DRAFT_362178 [Linnemannia elongata]
MISMEEFIDAHVSHHSIRNNKPVAPFFFTKSNPSGPDLVFVIRFDGARTVSGAKIEGHAKTFRKYCPNNLYISMIYDKLLAPSELPKDSSGVQQVVINISDNNFGHIFPQEHVEFIDRHKNTRKRSSNDDDSNDEDFPEKQS